MAEKADFGQFLSMSNGFLEGESLIDLGEKWIPSLFAGFDRFGSPTRERVVFVRHGDGAFGEDGGDGPNADFSALLE